MRKLLLLAASLLSLAVEDAAASVRSVDPADLPAGRYELDKAHGSVLARVSHMGFSQYTLRFDQMDAQFDYDPTAPTRSKILVQVKPASINTGDKAFDRQLADGWFEAKRFPTVTFASTSVDLGDGHRGRVTGDLTMHGITRQVVLDVTFNGVGSGLIPGTLRTGFSATVVIRRSDYGMTKYLAWVGDDVTLLIEAEFTRK